jgi:hypothetical protein
MTVRETWVSGSHWPVALWWILLIVLALWIRWLYVRSLRSPAARRTWWLRFAAIVVVMVALADLTYQRFEVQLPELVVAIDNSASMSLPQGPAATDQTTTVSRLDRVRRVLDQRQLEALSRRYQLTFWTLGTAASRLPASTSREDLGMLLTGTQPQSRLGDGLQQIVDHQAGRHTAGILLFSDGAVTAGRSLDKAGIEAGRQSIPVFVAGTGSRQPPPDLTLEKMRANRRVRVDEPLTVSVDLTASGMAGQSCRVQIFDKASGDLLAAQDVLVETNTFQRSLSLRVVNQREGTRTLLMTASTALPEFRQDNNNVEQVIQVVSGRIRILIVQDYPDPWYRFLKQTLLRAIDAETGQAAFEVRTLLQQAASGYANIDDTAVDRFPVAAELSGYDVVILGDARLDGTGRDRGLTSADCQTLAAWVQSGAGNLVFVPGSRHSDDLFDEISLAPLLPVSAEAPPEALSDSRWYLQFTEMAERLGPFQGMRDEAGSLPPVPVYIYPVSVNDELAVVIAEFVAVEQTRDLPRRPAITLQRIGSGTVISHFSSDLYRMRFRSSEDLFGRYWIRLASGLAAERLQRQDRRVLLTTDASRYAADQPVEISAEILDPQFDSLTNPSIEVMLMDDDKRAGTVSLRPLESGMALYRGSIGPLQPGNYRVVLNFPGLDADLVESAFQVGEANVEWQMPNQQQEPLMQLARNSGGLYVDVADIQQLWRQLPRGTWNRSGVSIARTLWSWPWIPFLGALSLIGLLVLEWSIGRRLRLE